MNYSWSWAYESKYYEQLKVVDDMNIRSWAQGSRCYKQLRTMVDMNDSKS